MRKIYKIGLTGPSGAGKSALAKYFIHLSIPVLDADKIYHELLDEGGKCVSELVSEFGENILNDGKVDRRLLAGIVFAQGAEKRLLKLNEITHRHVIERMRTLTEKHEADGKEFVLIDAPLLIEAKIDKECDTVISVLANEDTRRSRICERDGIDEEAAKKRIRSQKPEEFYIDASDITVRNDAGLGQLEDEFRKIAARLGIVRKGDVMQG